MIIDKESPWNHLLCLLNDMGILLREPSGIFQFDRQSKVGKEIIGNLRFIESECGLTREQKFAVVRLVINFTLCVVERTDFNSGHGESDVILT